MTVRNPSEMTGEEMIQRHHDIKERLKNLSLEEIRQIKLDPISIEVLMRIKFGIMATERQTLQEELTLCVDMEKVGLDAGNREHRSIYEKSLKKG